MIPGTWSQAMAGALSVLLILGAAFLSAKRRKRNRLINRRLKSACVIDYSAKRAERLRQLGDDYLLARPINRKA